MMIIRVCLSEEETKVSLHLEIHSEHKISSHVNVLYYMNLREGGQTAACFVPWDYLKPRALGWH